MSKPIDLAGGWDVLWSRIAADMPAGASRVLLSVAAILVVYSFVMWVWGRSTGKSRGGSSIVWTLVIAAILAAPGVLIPIVLSAVDTILNLVLSGFGV